MCLSGVSPPGQEHRNRSGTVTYARRSRACTGWGRPGFVHGRYGPERVSGGTPGPERRRGRFVAGLSV